MKTARDIRRRYNSSLQDIRWKDFCADMFAISSDCDHPNGKCWACETTEYLQVHHLVYRDDREPWEYEPHEVRVLCCDCHKSIHKIADIVWVECLRFEPHEIEIFLKQLKSNRRLPSNYRELGELSD